MYSHTLLYENINNQVQRKFVNITYEVIVQLVATISTIITRAFEVNTINVDIIDPETKPVNSPLVHTIDAAGSEARSLAYCNSIVDRH